MDGFDEEVLIKSNNKVAFLLYHDFNYTEMRMLDDRAIVFVFKNTYLLQECLKDFADCMSNKRPCYLEYSKLNYCNTYVRNLIRSYKRENKD